MGCLGNNVTSEENNTNNKTESNKNTIPTESNKKEVSKLAHSEHKSNNFNPKDNNINTTNKESKNAKIINEVEKDEQEEFEYQRLKEEEISKILPSEKDTPSMSCIFVGVHGNFFTDKEKALQRINEIRKEACDEGVKDPRTKKKFTPSDYKPYKWSTELEFVSRIRAVEAGLTMEHERLNGKDIWTLEKNGIASSGENLAWNWKGANSLDMIDQWYKEKKDWVTGGKGVTGHYEHLISSRYSYVGLGWFDSTCTKYPSCLAGSFSSETKTEDFIEEKRDIIQTLVY